MNDLNDLQVHRKSYESIFPTNKTSEMVRRIFVDKFGNKIDHFFYPNNGGHSDKWTEILITEEAS